MRARCGVDDRPAVGIVATLRDWKGHDQLLDAWATLRARVPGLAAPRHRRRPAARAPRGARRCDGVRADVRFVGNRDDVPAWLSCLDVVALPSYGEEGVPQSLMQAAACGLPAVSTTVGAIREAVIDGETGLIVPPKDVPALSAALERLMADAGLRTRMGIAARARAEREFGIDRMLDAMERVFAAAAPSAATDGARIGGHR